MDPAVPDEVCVAATGTVVPLLVAVTTTVTWEGLVLPGSDAVNTEVTTAVVGGIDDWETMDVDVTGVLLGWTVVVEVGEGELTDEETAEEIDEAIDEVSREVEVVRCVVEPGVDEPAAVVLVVAMEVLFEAMAGYRYPALPNRRVPRYLWHCRAR